MRKFLYLAVLSVVATLAFPSVAMAQYVTGPLGGPNGECSDAAELVEPTPELYFLPDIGGCMDVGGSNPFGPLVNSLSSYGVYDPDTGELLGFAKDLDPDLSSGANSVTYQEFCGDFDKSAIPAQEYFEQYANAQEQAILDPDGDGLACTAEDEAFLAGDTGASEADNGVDGAQQYQYADEADGGDGEEPGDVQYEDGEEPGQDDPQCIDGILDRNGDGQISSIEAAQAGADATQGGDPCPGTGEGQQPGDGAGDAGADDETGSQFEQTWTGTITQTGQDGTVTAEYGVEADIIMPVSDMTEGSVGEVVGEVTYESLQCSGVWVLEEVNEDSVQVQEQIEEPVGNCIEFVPITLTPQEDGSLEYYFEINNDTGRGVLTRQGSSAPDGGMDGQQSVDTEPDQDVPGNRETGGGDSGGWLGGGGGDGIDMVTDRVSDTTTYIVYGIHDAVIYCGGMVADTASNLRRGRLPDTGGGWTVLLFAGAALVGGGWLLVRRFSR